MHQLTEPNSESLESKSISSEEDMVDERFAMPMEEKYTTRKSFVEGISSSIRINDKRSGDKRNSKHQFK